MATIDRDLIRAINSGNCFALVGAGPSCELGLPTWHKLAESALSLLSSKKHKADIVSGRELLAMKKYPTIFSIVEKAIGLDLLIDHLKNSFNTLTNSGIIYSFLARWPFAVYLTTNYDDCLSVYLKNENLSFPIRHNSQGDIRTLRSDSKGIIYKIHGDFSTPMDIVLTEEKYDEFRKSEARKYWREKIRSVLHMVNLIIIGYTASDPDFKDQLELAKDLASPNHPIFMFAAEVNSVDISKYYQEYNIRIIPYSNPDGSHRELHRVLKRYDSFIAKRDTQYIRIEPIDEEKAKLASSIHIFTRLNLSDAESSCLKKSYEALIMSVLWYSGQCGDFSLKSLQNEIEKRLHITHIDPKNLNEALDSLYSRGYIEVEPNHNQYRLSLSGQEKIKETKAQHKLRQDQFNEACRLFLYREYPGLNDIAQNEVIKRLEEGLVRAFEKRGAEMAQATFSTNKLDLSNASDILDTINKQSSLLIDNICRAAFTDLMLAILLNPTREMKERLADLSQGYFSYHALGLDPKCSDERLKVAQKKAWILDSSIILPLLAKDCINHEFAIDMLDKMKKFKLDLVTTGRLFDEVIEHAAWAIRNFKDINPDSPSLLLVASGAPGYKQNLFIDGYIKWANQQGTSSIERYFRACLGEDYENKTKECIENQVKNLGINVVEFSEWPKFQPEQWSECDEIEKKIIEQRKQRFTYRSVMQCRAEAEVLILCEAKKAAFLSQSEILDSIYREKPRITWKPESMYRFLSSFYTGLPSDDLLYQSMVQDFFYCGFDIVNGESLKNYFIGPIRQSRLNLDEEKDQYEKAIGKTAYKTLRDDYDHTPDIQKPFFSMQFGFYVARKEIENRKKAEDRAISAEKTKKLNEKERIMFERLKQKKAEKKYRNKKRQQHKQNKKKKSKKRKKK